MSKTILVTGATGNIGSHLVKELNKTEHHILKATSLQSEHGKDHNIYLDFADKTSLLEAFSLADTVFLLFPMVEQMIDFARNAVGVAKKAGVQTIVRSSGAGADSNAGFLMPKVQGTIDDLIVSSGIPYVITQPASFMQNFVNFFAHDVKNGAVYLPVGNGKIAWIDVRDIARVNASILDNPSPYLNTKITLTGATNLSYAESLAIISKAIGKEVQFVDVAEDASKQAMKAMGMPDFIIDMSASLNQIIKAGYAEGTSTAVQDITGKAPIAFEQFVEDYKKFWI